MRRSPDDRNGGFWAVRHTYDARAEARGFCAKWNAALRAIKDADPVRLLPQDLLGGYALRNTHCAPAADTMLPTRDLAAVRIQAGERVRELLEQATSGEYENRLCRRLAAFH